MLVEPAPQELIERLAPELCLQKRQKERALLVRHHRIGIVRIAPFQVWLERAIAGRRDVRSRLSEIAETDDAFHVRGRLP